MPRPPNSLLWALLLASTIPTAVPVILVAGFDFTVQPAWIMAGMGFLGMAHTGSTGFFYTEEHDRRRMIWVPLGFIALAAAVFALDPAGFWPYLAVHYIWLMWHLGRQNFGLYALVAGGASEAERFFFDLLAEAAMPAMLTLYIPDALAPDAAAFLRVLSLLLMAYAVLLFICLTVGYYREAVAAGRTRSVVSQGAECNGGAEIQTVASCRYWSRPTALFLGLAFWLPTVISTNPAVALTWFAHPFQYLIMVAWVSGRRGWVELAVAAGYALGLWALLTGLYSAGALLAFSALTYGASQAHFLIDGEVWRRGRAVV